MKHSLFTLAFILSVSIFSVAQDGAYHLDEEYKVSPNGTIDLSSSDAHVFITGTDRTTARVKIDRKVEIKGFHSSRDEFSVEVTPENGNLKIKEYQRSVSGGIITYYKEEYRIEIEAPVGVSLNIRGDDGDYYVKNINGSIVMNVDDADVELANCKGSRFSFRIDDGDIRMDGGSGSIDIEADDADVEIYNAAFQSISADMDDGDLIIETALVENGIYNFDSQDGLISLTVLGGGGEFDIRHDDGSVIYNGAFNPTYESEERTKLTLRSGTAKVTVRADDARVKLTSRN